jgi:hypothetical protein
LHLNKKTPFHKDKGWCSQRKASVTNLPCCLLLIIFVPLGNQREKNLRVYFLLRTDWIITFFFGSWNSQCYCFLLNQNSQKLNAFFLLSLIIVVLDHVNTKLISALTSELRSKRKTMTVEQIYIFTGISISLQYRVTNENIPQTKD